MNIQWPTTPGNFLKTNLPSIVFVLWQRLKGGKVLNISFMSLKQFLVDKRITIIAFCRFTCDVHCRSQSPWLPWQSPVGRAYFSGPSRSASCVWLIRFRFSLEKQQVQRSLCYSNRCPSVYPFIGLTGRHSNETIAFRNKSLPPCFGLIWGRKIKVKNKHHGNGIDFAGRLLGIAWHQQSTPNPTKFNQVNFDQGVTYSIRWTPARL